MSISLSKNIQNIYMDETVKSGVCKAAEMEIYGILQENKNSNFKKTLFTNM